MLDLVVRGGQVVTEQSSQLCDVGIQAGRVVQMGGDMQGRRELDAAGCLVLPGAIDMHVHFLTREEARGREGRPAWCDDFESGSAAALAGGITTVGNMTVPHAGESLLEGLRRVRREAADEVMADTVLHPVLAEPAPDSISQVLEAANAGVRTLKMFMVSPAFDAGASYVVDVLRAARERGLLILLHPEDAGVITSFVRQLVANGQGSLEHYGESRPPGAETLAVERACGLARVTGAAVYLVHVSLAESLEIVVRARAQGARVYVETRPLYLHLTEESMREPDRGKYIGQPPLRSRQDQDALWRGLETGLVDTVGSDHAPWRLADKLEPGLTVEHLRPGVANLEWELPMLYSEGVAKGRLSLRQLVRSLSETPARLLGLYPRKGTLAEGSDADLVVLDPGARRPVGPPYRTRAGYSVYDGWIVTGWPRFTVRRGEVVFAEGKLQSQPGSGRILTLEPGGTSPVGS